MKMKKIISIALLGATTSLMAMYGESAYLYKDPRIMGMGGANVAVGGFSTSIFSNPAGLASIKKEHGIVVDLLGLGMSISGESLQDMADDIDTAETDDEMTQVLSDFSGTNFHVGIDNYTAISKNSDAFAWTIGALGAADINIMAHGNGSDNGALLESSSRAYGGLFLGVAKPYNTEIGLLDVGFSLKYISQRSYEGALTISELLDDTVDLADQMQEKYETESTGIGFDIGVNYHPFQESSLNPVIGMSVLNIGSMSMDDSYGGQPMTVNLGISISPDVSFLNQLVLAIDYVDVFNANKIRMYDYNAVDDSVVYTDYDESDYMKKLRVGLGIGLFDGWFMSTKLNGGMYQGAYTAGLDIELLLLKISVATYQEQLGSGSVDIPDRRYMAKLGFGW